MPKYKVYVSYEIKVYETFEVVVGEDENLTSEERAEELVEFEEFPTDFCCFENRTEKIEGDIHAGPWVEVEEIGILDRIPEQKDDAWGAVVRTATKKDSRHGEDAPPR